MIEITPESIIQLMFDANAPYVETKMIKQIHTKLCEFDKRIWIDNCRDYFQWMMVQALFHETKFEGDTLLFQDQTKKHLVLKPDEFDDDHWKHFVDIIKQYIWNYTFECKKVQVVCNELLAMNEKNTETIQKLSLSVRLNKNELLRLLPYKTQDRKL